MTKIKAIGFDMGGVLVEDPSVNAIKYCADAFGVSVLVFLQEFEKYFNEFQLGKITERIIWRKLAVTFDVKMPENASLWKDAIGSSYKEKDDMLLLLNELKKQGYMLGLLSNTEIPTIEYLYENNNNFLKIFDVAIFSCLENYVKPSKEIFEILICKLNVFPSEIIFIDDKPENLEGVTSCQINAIQFESYNQLLSELNKYSVVIN
jgi:putative hydrolase of the HAD superfamily